MSQHKSLVTSHTSGILDQCSSTFLLWCTLKDVLTNSCTLFTHTPSVSPT